MREVLVVSVHPDDETLGCAGTLLKHKENGDKIHWLICTEVKEDNVFQEKRNEEIKKVRELYDFDSCHNLKFPTRRIDEICFSDLIESVSNIINKVRPEIVYLPFKGDVHTDHRKIFEAAYSCTKSFRYSFVNEVYMMEVLSETEFAPATKDDAFIPNTFVDISKYMDKKIQIMNVFESEVSEHPFPRSERNIRALGTFRGATAGCEYAESFMLLKAIR